MNQSQTIPDRPKRKRIKPLTLQRAKQLRRKSTFPERLLWSILRRQQLGGLKFRRQHPVGPFIAEFYCAEEHLIVELDGRSHAGRSKEDQQRDEYLKSQGLRTIRFTNDQVLASISAVGRAILRETGRATGFDDPNLPLPLPKRGGGGKP